MYIAERGVHSLFVTDYTSNEQTGVVQDKWCPSSISDKVLRIEMWDDAAEMGPSMKPGEIYSIRNARMITNHYTGYLQAKLQQNKMLRLTETDAATNPHLKNLLELVLSTHFLPLLLKYSMTGERGSGREPSLIHTMRQSIALLKNLKKTNS